MAWLERDQRRLWLATGLGYLLVCWLAFFQNLGTLSLMDKTEALFVEVGHQMAERGDWITPIWNGELFFDYPVWGYWMVGLSFRLFGVSEWAARLPVALAASAVVLAGFGLLWASAPAAESLRQRWGRAAFGAALLALNPGWIGWGRSSVTDMFLASAIALSLFAFFLSYSHPRGSGARRLGLVAMPLFSAIAVLAKGPVGLVLPGLVAVVFLAAQGQLLAYMRRLPWWPVAGIFLVVVLPWYVLAAQAHGMAFLGGFFGFSNIERFTSVLYRHAGPWHFYLPWVLILLLPWSFHLPVALVRLRFWQLKAWRRQPPQAQLAFFALVWFLAVLLFFSAAATKLAGYILPLVPAAALLLALYWFPLATVAPAGGNPDLAPDRPQRWSGWVNALVFAALAPAAAVAPRWAATDPAYPGFADALSRSGLPLILALILAGGAAGLLLLLLRPGRPRALWLPDLAAMLLLLALVVPPLAPLMESQRQRPVRELAERAGELAAPGEPLWVVGYMRYSVVFYSGREVVFIDSPKGAREALRQRPAPGSAAGSVLIFGEEHRLRDLAGKLPGSSLLESRSGHQLWRVPRPKGSVDRAR
ncbi:glycosyltransferase family 39 protein [Synechococcus sp. CS-1329]|uniref:ArnT family glycosyltransferase n=1 Tax=Synechococcus sp. CS-1329 TaxID=2847975 RepID=UPI00223B59C8|nr:glycosyltransferase family 39 protein [Synechococcus sp. CS-1329]MCT0219708.1 glycosyltransferase family 39 protein [Synechococcus sp. CS-1329]